MMKKTLILTVLVLSVASLASAQCETLTFLTESLPEFPLNEPAHFDIEISGGTAPYHFEIIDGTLPDGLHFNASGGFRGKPRESVDTTIFVTVTDANGCQLTSAFALRTGDQV